MEDTSTFFQIRSATVRLRRAIQECGFITPLDVEHSIFATNGEKPAVSEFLLAEGYDEIEVRRALEWCIRERKVEQTGSVISVRDERRSIARRYFVLDTVAQFGSAPHGNGDLKGSLLIPGYGPFFGMKFDELASKSAELAPGVRDGLERRNAAGRHPLAVRTRHRDVALNQSARRTSKITGRRQVILHLKTPELRRSGAFFLCTPGMGVS